jgi:hypothetical protein
VRSLRQQGDRVDPDPARDALQPPECEIALASLEGACLGAVVPEHLAKGFLAQAKSVPMRPEAAAYGPLEIAFHTWKAPRLLPLNLQTYK